MTTLYPGAQDNFSNPAPDSSQAASRSHSEQHSDLNDAVEAIEAALGTIGQPNTPMSLRPDLAATGAGKGGYLVRWIQSGVGAVARWITDKLLERASLLDYIPEAEHAAIKAGGSTYDCTADILKAVTAHKRVFAPEGLYLMSGTVAIPAGHKLYGDGRQATRFGRAGANLSFFVLGANAEIHGVGFTRSGATTATSGRLIDVQVSGCKVTDIYADHCWDGIYITSCAGIFMDQLYINGWQNSGIRVDGGTNDVVLSNTILTSGTTGAGLRLLNKCEALYATNVDIIGGEYSMITGATGAFAPGTGTMPAFCRFANCFFDSSTTGAWLDKSNDFRFTNCWFSNRPGNGLTINQCYDVTCSNSIFANCGSSGASLNSASLRNVQFIGCGFNSNNSQNNGSNGLTVVAGASDWSVVNCYANNSMFAANTQGYGVYVTAGASNYYTVLGCNLRGNGAGGMFDGGMGTDKKISGNVGYDPPTIAPTFLNSWSNLGGPHQTAAYWKDSDGVVHLAGAIQSGVVPSAAFVLPAGFRPSAQQIFACVSNDALGRIDIKAAGDVEVTSGSNVFVSLAGITFKAA